MIDLENALYLTLCALFLLILLMLGFAVVHDTRPQCWISKAPFVCEEVYRLKEQKETTCQ